MSRVAALFDEWTDELSDRGFYSGDPSPWVTRLLLQWVPELAKAIDGGEQAVAVLLQQKKDELAGRRDYAGDTDANTTDERRKRIEALELAVTGK